MDSKTEGSGDNGNSQQCPGGAKTCVLSNINFDDSSKTHPNDNEASTAQMIDDSEMKLKERITQCKMVIDSLKLELKEEKNKLQNNSMSINNNAENVIKCNTSVQNVCSPEMLNTDFGISNDIYSACIESKLYCDESLMEYEKQLQKYQNTLNMAQSEKKNVIRKQMLAKAFKLKLLEIENQCNVELLRVKQSLQCLEPLKIIASKWKSNPESTFEDNSFESLSLYPELNAYPVSETNSFINFSTKHSDEENDECGKKVA